MAKPEELDVNRKTAGGGDAEKATRQYESVKRAGMLLMKPRPRY